ncbi:LacI family DNA-binding transcriptional regulator [Jiangella rhizosphaerae]|uniref:LacI family transcriptional regulator n=1 Tax=Jiangella rhizosphaerae TaxID=2293569 RepID=A0A418KLY9_9ACTN|nr:LacI family DNA-binding transcriptional regulator [Jiangella rhizosphaerae]RIQ18957.1 LacI family transcriptional regulator [Jiangella rhizosphaerae]
MIPTMHDVARAAGVSIKTVSNVINDFPHVRPSTRMRVLSAIEELGYRPNLSARGLRSGRTGVIGLAVPELRQNYFAELADSVIRAAEKHDLGVLVEQTSGDRDREIAVVTGAGRLRLTDGLLFSPERLGQADRHLIRPTFPFVLLGERIFGGPTDHVTMHNVSSAKAAVDHLLQIGRRRIALIGAHPDQREDVRPADLRVRGYKAALEAAGIPLDPQLIRAVAPWHRENGAEAMRELIASGIPFDGLFALNDTLALGALRALGEAGWQVPGDVAVIGFDDIDEARFSVPSLSSVDPGRDEIAETAVELLVERINEKDGDPLPPLLVKSEFRIVARESTGFGRPG